MPAALSDASPAPYGGNEHRLTIIESCLRLAEIEAKVEKPRHDEEFKTRMRASISHDRKLMMPQTLGFPRDSSGNTYDSGIDIHDLDENIVTYNGVTY